MRTSCAAALAVLAACGTPPDPAQSDAALVAPVEQAEPAESGEQPEPALPPEVRGFTPEEVATILKLSPLPDPPLDPTNRVDGDPRAERLGQFVFFDQRFSRSGDISCATCHDPLQEWADTRRLGKGEAVLPRHSMTLWNVAYNRWFFWDGRADSLWAQAVQPLEDPREHGISRLQVAHLFYDDADLRRAYEELFGALPPLDDASRFPAEGRPVPDDPDHPHAAAWSSMSDADRDAINAVFVNVAKSIASFERRIVSRQSAFDDFVAAVRSGDLLQQLAINEEARNGLKLFLGKARCVLCHSGPNFTDREFHDNRVPPLKGGKRLDAGRYEGVELAKADAFNGIGSYSDAPEGAAEDKVGFLLRSGHNWSEFKTPSLRNAVVTAPYMHQGQLGTLDEVLRFYNTLEGAVPNHHQAERILQPLGLTDGELADLHAFLVTLTDVRIDPELTRQPPTPYLP
ncbi:MAG: cytochrome c peroxidase [Planctomycetota bacterium]